ncbi:MAG: hypothetical protein BJ554DRAFT_5716 [Olpidium bornovanus]|uniref:Uncharacterized protein n=1 Tax=Olpidium bornovanus TaxID=278681 RepID=A0A8H7ZYY5_9FUNG|nr:MAG: hypothetical protein BJ554DRAFT_5716 [Olpidium bornovanus]
MSQVGQATLPRRGVDASRTLVACRDGRAPPPPTFLAPRPRSSGTVLFASFFFPFFGWIAGNPGRGSTALKQFVSPRLWPEFCPQPRTSRTRGSGGWSRSGQYSGYTTSGRATSTRCTISERPYPKSFSTTSSRRGTRTRTSSRSGRRTASKSCAACGASSRRIQILARPASAGFRRRSWKKGGSSSVCSAGAGDARAATEKCAER